MWVWRNWAAVCDLGLALEISWTSLCIWTTYHCISNKTRCLLRHSCAFRECSQLFIPHHLILKFRELREWEEGGGESGIWRYHGSVYYFWNHSPEICRLQIFSTQVPFNLLICPCAISDAWSVMWVWQRIWARAKKAHLTLTLSDTASTQKPSTLWW